MYRSQQRICNPFFASIVNQYRVLSRCTLENVVGCVEEFVLPVAPRLPFLDIDDLEEQVSSPLIGIVGILDEIASKHDIATLDAHAKMSEAGFAMRFCHISKELKPAAIKCLDLLHDFIALSDLSSKAIVSPRAMRTAIAFTQFVDLDVAASAVRLFAVSSVNCAQEPPYSFMEMIVRLVIETPLENGILIDGNSRPTLAEYISIKAGSDSNQPNNLSENLRPSPAEVALYRFQCSLPDYRSRMTFLRYYYYSVSLLLIVLGEQGFEQQIAPRAPTLWENTLNCLRVAETEAKLVMLPALNCTLASFRTSLRQKLLKKWNLSSLFGALLDPCVEPLELMYLADITSIASNEELAIFMTAFGERLLEFHERYNCATVFSGSNLDPLGINLTVGDRVLLRTKQAVPFAISQLLEHLSSRFSVAPDFFPVLARNIDIDYNLFMQGKSLIFMSNLNHWLTIIADLSIHDPRESIAEMEHVCLNSPVINILFEFVSSADIFRNTIVDIIREAALTLENLFCSNTAGRKFILHNGGYYERLLNGFDEVLSLEYAFDSVAYLPAILGILNVALDDSNEAACTSNVKKVWNSFHPKYVDLLCIDSKRSSEFSDTAVEMSVVALNMAKEHDWFDTDFLALDILFRNAQERLNACGSTPGHQSQLLGTPTINFSVLRQFFEHYQDAESGPIDLMTSEGIKCALEVGWCERGLLRHFVSSGGSDSRFVRHIYDASFTFDLTSDTGLLSATRVAASTLRLFSSYLSVSERVIDRWRARLPSTILVPFLVKQFQASEKSIDATLIATFVEATYFRFLPTSECFRLYNAFLSFVRSTFRPLATQHKNKWDQANTQDLENATKALRSLLQYCDRSPTQPDKEIIKRFMLRLRTLFYDMVKSNIPECISDALLDCIMDVNICTAVLPGPHFFIDILEKLVESTGVKGYITMERVLMGNCAVYDFIYICITEGELKQLKNFDSLADLTDDSVFFTAEQGLHILHECERWSRSRLPGDFDEGVRLMMDAAVLVLSGLSISATTVAQERSLCWTGLQICANIVHSFSVCARDWQVMGYLHQIWFHTLHRLPYSFQHPQFSSAEMIRFSRSPSLSNLSAQAEEFLDNEVFDYENLTGYVDELIFLLDGALEEESRDAKDLEASIVGLSWLLSFMAKSEVMCLVNLANGNYQQILNKHLERYGCCVERGESEDGFEGAPIIAAALSEALRVYYQVLVTPGPVLDQLFTQKISAKDTYTGVVKVPMFSEVRFSDALILEAPHAEQILAANVVEVLDPHRNESFYFSRVAIDQILKRPTDLSSSSAGVECPYNWNEDTAHYLPTLKKSVGTVFETLLTTRSVFHAQVLLNALIDMATTTQLLGAALLELQSESARNLLREVLLVFGTQKLIEDPRAAEQSKSETAVDSVIKFLSALTRVPADSSYNAYMYAQVVALTRLVYAEIKGGILSYIPHFARSRPAYAVSLLHVCCDVIQETIHFEKSLMKLKFLEWATQSGKLYVLEVAREVDLLAVVASGFAMLDPGSLDMAACGTCYWSLFEKVLSAHSISFSSAGNDDIDKAADSEMDEDTATNNRILHETRVNDARNNGRIFRNSALADYDADAVSGDGDEDEYESSIVNSDIEVDMDSEDIVSVEDYSHDETDSQDDIMIVDPEYDSSSDSGAVSLNLNVVIDGSVDIQSDEVDIIIGHPSDDTDDPESQNLNLEDVGLLDRLLTWYTGNSRVQSFEDETDAEAQNGAVEYLNGDPTSDSYKAEYAAAVFRSTGYPESMNAFLHVKPGNAFLCSWKASMSDEEKMSLFVMAENLYSSGSAHEPGLAGNFDDVKRYVSAQERRQKEDWDHVFKFKGDRDLGANCLPQLVSAIVKLFFGPTVLTEDLDELYQVAIILLESEQGCNLSLQFFKDFLEELSRGCVNMQRMYQKVTESLIGGIDEVSVPDDRYDTLSTPAMVGSNIIEFLSMFTSHDKNFREYAHPALLERRTKLFCSRLTEMLGEKLIMILTRAPIARNGRALQRATSVVRDICSNSFFGKIKVSKKTQTKLITLLGSKTCSSNSFSNIAELIRSYLDFADFMTGVVEEARKTKSFLLSHSSTFYEGISRGSVTLDQADHFFAHQIKLLRLLALVSEVYDGEDSVKIYREINLLPLWQVVAQQVVSSQKTHTIGFAACVMLLESLAIPAVTVHDWRTHLTAGEPVDGSVETAAVAIENFSAHFLSRHKVLINGILSAKPHLALGSLGDAARIYKVLDFENKRRIFKLTVKQLKNDLSANKRTIAVYRDRTLEDSYQFFKREQPSRGHFKVHFKNEYGQDVGGLSREWLDVLGTALVEPQNFMFRPAIPGSSVYCINEQSVSLPDYEDRFRFVGWLLARAVFDERTVGLHFTRAIYKFLLSLDVTLNDMSAVDEDYSKSLTWMLENDITDVIFESMCVEITTKDNVKTFVDLVPNGASVPVTEENKRLYVKKVVEYKLLECVRPQLEALREGFNRVLDLKHYDIFDEQELELMICGLPTIDVEDWHRNTNYDGYSADSPQIKWFWSAVASFSTEERAKLLQFCTGTSRVPVRGFEHLESLDGTNKFVIHHVASKTHLPTSHTCMNQLDLPAYESPRKLKAMLLKAITEGNVGFGFI